MPASHVYVRHLSNLDGADDVVRLQDPVPKDGRTVPGGWWPPLMLEPGWVSENRDRFDVFHVHFGFDAIGPDVLAAVMEELKEHRKPLLYTMHDLRNPHHPDPEAHSAQQDILVAAADELVTLTPGAAQTILRRWGRSSHVVPHPHVLEPRLDREALAVPTTNSSSEYTPKAFAPIWIRCRSSMRWSISRRRYRTRFSKSTSTMRSSMPQTIGTHRRPGARC